MCDLRLLIVEKRSGCADLGSVDEDFIYLRHRPDRQNQIGSIAARSKLCGPPEPESACCRLAFRCGPWELCNVPSMVVERRLCVFRPIVRTLPPVPAEVDEGRSCQC